MYSAFEVWGKFIFRNGLFSYWYLGNSNLWRYDSIWASSVRLRHEPAAWHGTFPLYRNELSREQHLRGLLDLRIVSLKAVSAEMSTKQAHCQLSCFMVAKCTGAKKSLSGAI